MTRFARAKGSKADNSKTPEPASNWRELKQGLVSSDKATKSHSDIPVAPAESTESARKFKKKVWAEIDPKNSKVNKKRKLESNADHQEPEAESTSLSTLISKGSKKKRCFNCRKTGHAIKDCPQIDGECESVCYNCGSTEHNVSKCNKKRNKNNPFEFATCFICKEQGHLSSSCPDNPNGLYPNGGGCKLCGEVTHLYKSCPKYLAQVERKAVTVDVISRDIEGLEYVKPTQKPVVKKVKVVKF